MVDTKTKPDESKPDEAKSEKFVRYIGTADVREIAKADGWDNVGASDDKKVWDRRNGWKIPVSEFSDEALAYLHEVDDGFVVDQ